MSDLIYYVYLDMAVSLIMAKAILHDFFANLNLPKCNRKSYRRYKLTNNTVKNTP